MASMVIQRKEILLALWVRHLWIGPSAVPMKIDRIKQVGNRRHRIIAMASMEPSAFRMALGDLEYTLQFSILAYKIILLRSDFQRDLLLILLIVYRVHQT